MKTKICRYCRTEFKEIDFPAQFKRMITCGNPECMELRRWERLGIDIEDKKDNIDSQE
ncbi:MAG: hypothetical protein KKC75_00460 [Nanoarchaeota archaeon]|nr:hypothetical protein [Nanoarchaeota archaeon]MBU1005190.1 hypothetical protein [Nanoarchaeota archaeon]MBU1946861.1 hypothetical protein [Nanoarchaeota archaeon]